MKLSKKIINAICWWIPIRKIRDVLRSFLSEYIGLSNITEESQVDFSKIAEDIRIKLSKIDVTDIYILSDLKDDYYYYTYFQELNEGNKLYSHSYSLKDYSGFDQKYVLKAAIEHGIRAHEMELEGLPEIKSPLPACFTSGGILGKQYISKVCNKKIYDVGPYIHYAREYLSEEQKEKEQKRLGKNLLVIPTHSCAFDSIAEYDTNALIEEIKKVAKNFDSVRVCLYWSDVIMGLDEVYKKEGFECVTAGHIYDIHFLSRLKSIIDLSSLVMGNEIGSQMIHSVYMKKPFYIFKQEITNINKIEDINERKRYDMLSELCGKSKYIPLFINAFSKYSETITKEQYDLVDKHCGLSSIKSKSELIEIFSETEELYKQMMNDYKNKDKYI